MLLDAWRLATGTLTAIPVPPPRVIKPLGASILAPLAVAPLAVGAGLLCLLPISPLLVGVVVVAFVVLGSRALHVDGLADTADGLTASYDRDRALEVMKTGDVGPAGTAAVVLVLLAQVLGVATSYDEPLVVGAAVALSRWALLLVCVQGVPAARAGGLGSSFAGVVPWPVAAGGVLVWGATMTLLAGPRGGIAVGVAVVAVALLVLRCKSRLGGSTGDVIGAGIEIALAAQLVALS